MERSSKYDWFKGPQQHKNKKSKAKANGKLVWKFSKIFGIFSILFLTLWGCGQSLVIRQDSHVGKSLEIYKNEESVPPHVSEFKVATTTPDTAGAKEIYSLTPLDSNIWLEKETNGKELMAAVKKEINHQGYKMSDAYRGVNESVRVVNEDGKLGSNPAIVTAADGTPIVLTSKNQNNTIPSYAPATSFFSNIIQAGANQTPGSDDSVPTNLNLLTKVGDTVVYEPLSWSGVAEDKNYSSYTAFKDALIDALGAHNGSNWILDALKLQGDYAIPDGALATGTLSSKYDAIQTAQTNAINVLSYVGYEISGDKIIPHFSAMPGSGGVTYRPIVTWGQAWERGFGPFYGLVVYPIAQVLVRIVDSMPSMAGWEALIAIVVVVVVLRALAFALSFKSTMQQTKMQELNLKKATIDAKYAAYKDNKQMQMRKSQEIQEMYKKENVSPLGSITSLLIVMPIFLAMWRLILSLPHLKSTVWLSINFSATSYKELFAGHVQYLPLLAIALVLSLASSFYGRLLTRRRDKLRGNAHLRSAMRKNDKVFYITIIISAFISIIFTAGIQIYSIIVSIWMIFQTHITHHLLVVSSKRKKAKDMGTYTGINWKFWSSKSGKTEKVKVKKEHKKINWKFWEAFQKPKNSKDKKSD